MIEQEQEVPHEVVATWERLSDDMSRAVPELHGIGSADLLRSVYTAGVRDGEVLNSLTALSLTNSQEFQTNYDQHILTLAQFLASPLPRKHSKRACIRILMTLRSPLEAGWQLQDVVIQDTLRFICERDYVWEYLDHSDEVLLWELRAICLMELEVRSEAICHKVIKGGNEAAGFISKQAVLVERGLDIAADVVEAGIEGAAAKLKESITPQAKPLLDESNEAILSYSEKAKTATDSVRRTSQQALIQFQSTSKNAIHGVADRIQNGGVGERVVPNENKRQILCVVGKVGIASVGAAALVADTLIQSTGQVVKKSAAVTAEIVEHKYGPKAGQLMRNSSDTVGNIFRTVGHVALLHKSRAMTKSVAKATGKAHVQRINEECASQSTESDDDSERFAEVDGDMFQDEVAEVMPEETSQETNEEAFLDDAPEEQDTSSSLSADSEVMVLEENDFTPFGFDTTMKLSPSELDSCLPDEITGVDARSDFFSDVTDEPSYERKRAFTDTLIKRVGSSRHSIFRNLDDSFERESQLPSKRAATCALHKKVLSEDDDDSSLDYTECTVDETYLTNNTFLSHDDELHPSQPFIADDIASHVSGFEKHYEAWAVGSEVSTAVAQENEDHFYRGSLIRPNGYVPSAKKEAGWLACVKSKFAH